MLMQKDAVVVLHGQNHDLGECFEGYGPFFLLAVKKPQQSNDESFSTI